MYLKISFFLKIKDSTLDVSKRLYKEERKGIERQGSDLKGMGECWISPLGWVVWNHHIAPLGGICHMFDYNGTVDFEAKNDPLLCNLQFDNSTLETNPRYS